MTIPTTTAAAEQWARRVLALTRTRAYLGDLKSHIGALGDDLTADLYGPESDDFDDFESALETLQQRTTHAWLGADTMRWAFAETERAALTERARRLAARADLVASTARTIALELSALEPFDDHARLTEAITDAASCLEDGQDTPDLTDLWHRLGPTELLTEHDTTSLRRRFDTDIDTTADPVEADVAAWRRDHLAAVPGPWETETFDYALATARTPDDWADIWARAHDAAHAGSITGAENVALRDRIADAIAQSDLTAEDLPGSLAKGLDAWASDSIQLAARIRHAGDWAALGRVYADLARHGEMRNLAQWRMLRNAVHERYRAGSQREREDGGYLIYHVSEWYRHLHNQATHVIGLVVRNDQADNLPAGRAAEILAAAISAAQDIRTAGGTADLARAVENARKVDRITEPEAERLRGMLDQ